MKPPAAFISGRRLLFMLIPVSALLLLAGATLSLWNIDLIRHRSRIRRLAVERIDDISLADMVKEMPPERSEHLRACYLHPEQIDLNRISWNVWEMPAPFLECAPEPGRQPGGVFNAQQMRDRRDVAMPKSEGVYRIFLTGGSFAYGAGAPDEDSLISSYFERDLGAQKAFGGRRIEVFDAALPDWTSTHERIRIENQIAELQPDLVVMLSGGNDVHWGTLGFSALSVRTYEGMMYFGVLNEAMQLAGARPFSGVPPVRAPGRIPPDEVARVFVRNIRLAAFALDQAGARCVLALQPTLSPANKPLSPGERTWLDQYEEKGKVDYLADCYARIDRLLDASGSGLNNNLIRINILDAFRDRPDPVFFDLYHTGDKGNSIVAGRLAEALTKLVPSAEERRIGGADATR